MLIADNKAIKIILLISFFSALNSNYGESCHIIVLTCLYIYQHIASHTKNFLFVALKHCLTLPDLPGFTEVLKKALL